MDIEEKYYNLKTNFYLHKAKQEMIYFVGIIIYCTAILGFVILTKEKFPTVYMNTAMKVILFVLLIAGMVFHYTMKYLFHAKFRYTKYYDGVFSFLNDGEISQIREKINEEASQMQSPHKEPFMRTVSSYLKNRGNS